MDRDRTVKLKLGLNDLLLLMILFVVVFQVVFEYKNYQLGLKKRALLMEREQLTKEVESLFGE